MRHANRALFVMIFAACAGSGWAGAAQAQSAGSASGLPVPRFVSLKADKVNMHIGPAKTYETKWLYQRAGLPVEITAEFENWRRIRDSDGTEGWVYHSLLVRQAHRHGDRQEPGRSGSRLREARSSRAR